MSETPGRTPLTRRNFLARTAGAGATMGLAPTLRSACGGSSSESGPMTFWNFYGPAKSAGAGTPAAQSKWFDDLVADWNESHEQQVKLQYIPNPEYISGAKLQTAFASGKGPDIFLISPGDFLRYYNGGVLFDLTPYLSKEVQDDFYPSVMRTRSVDGKIYALPMEVEPMAFGALAVFFFLANWNAFLWPLTITERPELWMIQVGMASLQNQYAASWN